MIKLLVKIPRQVTLAVSGGVDSMALLDFTSRNHDVSVAFFHHGTENSEKAFQFISHYCAEKNISLFTGYLTKERPRSASAEEHWRNERYAFLGKFGTVATAHHLDDCVETWVWGSLHGTPQLIPSRRGNVIRPLLTTRKKVLKSWCERNNVPWVEDKSNEDTNYMRNFIRHEMMPSVLRVNPGIHTMVQKKLLDRETEVRNW
jgi:tRNA(Ile)-lysidine synthase